MDLVESKFIQRPLMEISQLDNWRKLSARLSNHPKLFLQHMITSTKLSNANRHFKALEKLVPNHTAKDLMEIEFSKKKWISEIPSSLSQFEKILQFYDELEFIFYNLRSCIDSLLWEIKLMFELNCSKAAHVVPEMEKNFKEEEITKQLRSLKEKNWFKYLSEIRNNLIHRWLPEVAIDEELLLYLPRRISTNETNPQDYILGKQYELFSCLDELRKNIMDFLEKGYKILVQDFPKLVS